MKLHTKTGQFDAPELIYSGNGSQIAICRDSKTATHIVKCVNMHDELVDALENSVSAMNRMDALLLKLTNSPYECEKGEIARAKSAIAKAKGE